MNWRNYARSYESVVLFEISPWDIASDAKIKNLHAKMNGIRRAIKGSAAKYFHKNTTIEEFSPFSRIEQCCQRKILSNK